MPESFNSTISELPLEEQPAGSLLITIWLCLLYFLNAAGVGSSLYSPRDAEAPDFPEAAAAGKALIAKPEEGGPCMRSS